MTAPGREPEAYGFQPEIPVDGDDLRDRLAEALERVPLHGRLDCARVLDAVLPVVLAERETYAAQRAAEELRAAADVFLPTDYVARMLRDRAAALDAD